MRLDEPSSADRFLIYGDNGRDVCRDNSERPRGYRGRLLAGGGGRERERGRRTKVSSSVVLRWGEKEENAIPVSETENRTVKNGRRRTVPSGRSNDNYYRSHPVEWQIFLLAIRQWRTVRKPEKKNLRKTDMFLRYFYFYDANNFFLHFFLVFSSSVLRPMKFFSRYI